MLTQPNNPTSTAETRSPAPLMAGPGGTARVVAPGKIRFGAADAFQKALKRRVERYFSFTGLSPRDAWQMYVKTAVILGWFAASYVLLLLVASTWWMAIPLAVSLGLSVAAIGFNIQHDGGHRAFSDRKVVNKLAGMTMDLIGGSSYVWDHKHNTIHHTYPNIDGHDDDINVGPLARLAPQQRWHRFHRLQHIYIWILYGLITVKWQLYDDYYNIARGKIGNHRFARPKGLDLAIFIGGKAVFLTLAFVLPLLLHPPLMVVLLYLLIAWVSGVTMAIVFQLAHVVEEAEFPQPDADTGKMDNHWAIHQVETTVDFSRDNRVLSWFLGGLNFQIEHHLFPRICHVHYRRLSRLVERACKEFGVRYAAHRSFMAGLASHFRWIRRMGQPAT